VGRKRRQRNITSQKTNSNITENLVECEWDEVPVADIRRMMIRMFNELKDDKSNSMNPKRIWTKKNMRRQKKK
jgi:hypothetical protein